MALSVKHTLQTAIADDPSFDVSSSEWNADHGVTGTLPVANGGTDATTATAARANLGAAALTHTHAQGDVTNLVSDLALKAPLASPVFTGDPQSVTPATADNDTSIATTAFVKAQGYGAAVPPATVAPLVNGTAAVGSVAKYAKEDHIHPTDTSRAPLASPIFTGDPQAPTPATADNDTSIATTAYVKAQGYGALDADNTWTGIQGYAEVALTATTPITWNVDAAPVATVALNSGATTMNAPTNVVAGRVYTIRIANNAAPGTVAWNAAFDFSGGVAPTITATASAVDRFTFIGRSGNILEEIGRSQAIA
jgi:hypothetical protein